MDYPDFVGQTIVIITVNLYPVYVTENSRVSSQGEFHRLDFRVIQVRIKGKKIRSNGSCKRETADARKANKSIAS
jgi:hypothetical protein